MQRKNTRGLPRMALKMFGASVNENVPYNGPADGWLPAGGARCIGR